MDEITEATKFAVPKGFTVMQIFQFADTDEAHVKKLLALLDPVPNALVLDVGCGVGEVARLMLQDRPDLSFTLVNNNKYQLSLCRGFEQVNADMHNIPFQDGSFDIVMVNYAIGYADLRPVLDEFRRLLKANGVLFIVDVLGPSEQMRHMLQYRTYSPTVFVAALQATGFDPTRLRPDEISVRRFYELLNLLPFDTQTAAHSMLSTIVPAVWRCHRAS